MSTKEKIRQLLKTASGREKLDQTVKRLFARKEILCNILKYTVSEYRDCSLDKIMDCIEGDTLQTGTALVSEDMARTIRGENPGFSVMDEAAVTFDILFRALIPDREEQIKVNLHIDLEIQGDYRPGYPIVKRGIYYAGRQLSSQLPKVGKNGQGYRNLEKTYSIWICLRNIPKDMEDTISYYKIKNYKNEGFSDNNVPVDEDACDLMEIVIIRLGDNEALEKGILDFLHSIFSGNEEKADTYIPPSVDGGKREEVQEMISFISYAEEKGEKIGIKKGEKIGIKKGENRLAALIRILKKDNVEDALRVSEDEDFREKMYKKYNL